MLFWESESSSIDATAVVKDRRNFFSNWRRQRRRANLYGGVVPGDYRNRRPSTYLSGWLGRAWTGSRHGMDEINGVAVLPPALGLIVPGC